MSPKVWIEPDIYDGGHSILGKWKGAKAWAEEVKYIAGQTIEDIEGVDMWWLYASDLNMLEVIISDLERYDIYVSEILFSDDENEYRPWEDVKKDLGW